MESKQINTTNLHYTKYLANKYNLKDNEYEIFDKETFDNEFLEYYNYFPKNKDHILIKSDNDIYKLYKIDDVGLIISSAKYELVEEFQFRKLDVTILQDNVNKRYLMRLLEIDNAEDIENLLDSGLIENINFIESRSGETPLTKCTKIIHEYSYTIELLVEKYNADINMCNSVGIPPIISAILNNNIEAYNFLLDQENINLDIITDKGNTVLHYATCDLKYLKPLLEKYDKHINTKNNKGETPLHWVKIPLCTQLLLKQKNIDPTILDDNGNSFLHMQLYRGIVYIDLYHTDIIDMNSQNKDGQTLLHLALKYNNFHIAKVLLARDDIDINILNNDDISPLMMLCKADIYYSEKLLRLLLFRRPDININIKNKFGYTAIDYAESVDIKNILQNKIREKSY